MVLGKTGAPPGWVQVGPQVSRRLAVDLPGARFNMFRLDAGFRSQLHTHHEAQLDVVVSGHGLHRASVATVRHGRATQHVQSVPVGPGECYFVPPDLPHEFSVDASGPIVLLEVLLDARHAPGGPPRFRRPKGGRRSGWTPYEGNSGARRLLVAHAEGAEFAYYELPPGFHGARHVHPSMQAGLILSGEALHRMELSVRQGRRTLRQPTDLMVMAGDTYFVPADVPHESWVIGPDPVLALDVELRPARAGRQPRGSSAAATSP